MNRSERIKALQTTISFLSAELEELQKQERAAERIEPIHMQPEQPKPPAVVKPIRTETPKPKRNWEKEIGQIWMPRIFAFIMLLGVAWGFKAGVNAGILTPPLRLLLGCLTAIGLYVIGEKQIKQSRIALGLVLLGATVTTFVLTTFAAHYLYGYLPAAFAFLLNIGWIALGIWLSHKHRSEWLAIFVGVGGYIVPFLINSTQPNTYVFVGYELLLYVSLLAFATKHAYRWLYYMAFGMLHITLTVYSLVALQQLNLPALAVVIQHLCLLYILMTKRDSYLQDQIKVLLSSIVITVLWVASTDNNLLLKGLLTMLTLLYAGAYVWERQKGKIELLHTVFFCLSFYSLTLLVIDTVDNTYYPLAWLVQGTFGLYMSWKVKSHIKFIASGIVYALGAISTVLTSYTAVLSVQTLAWFVYLGTFAFLVMKLKATTKRDLSRLSTLVLLISTFIFITLFGSTLMQDQDFSIRQLVISSFWMIYALALVFYGNTKTEKMATYIGLIVIGITIIKLFFVDLFSVSLAIRSVLFIIVGTIGIFVSRVFYTKQKEVPRVENKEL
ncbi:DUF2339 domain-containing protein [Ectobacillus sp. JY-23]|uniref:DUF2339 domain-containing protein n=1 Tax=Ectobacillus sp. JY-23 TaxID=2933872 RepID=UPI001FF4A5C1|nr:DUF2339 domain-containing protein [Ectobacillus sp. JY-23]UOY91533.1 DUF2339 domain-containing protein [Ectobacillus sp. JY-23]